MNDTQVAADLHDDDILSYSIAVLKYIGPGPTGGPLSSIGFPWRRMSCSTSALILRAVVSRSLVLSLLSL